MTTGNEELQKKNEVIKSEISVVKRKNETIDDETKGL